MEPADPYLMSELHGQFEAGATHLVAREDEGVCDDNVLTTGSGEDNHLSDILRCQRFATAKKEWSVLISSSAGYFEHTRRRRPPWTCRRRTGRRRIPEHGISGPFCASGQD